MIDLIGKTALVLGGSRGIGAATARQLARQGADVAISYSSSAGAAEALVEQVQGLGRRALAIQANASQRGDYSAAVNRVISELGAPSILVVSGGTFDTGPINEISDERFDYSFDLHARSVFEAVRTALPHMNNGGSVITVSSIMAEIAPFPGLTLYTASKAAQAGLSRALAREVGDRGITVNAIQPGPIDTDMNPNDAEKNPGASTQTQLTALGRYGKPEEVAWLAAFLASDEARFITGQTINIDGGWTA
ncbi:MAG: SDR family oxidoreductase [Pseudomonadota bacterium]